MNLFSKNVRIKYVFLVFLAALCAYISLHFLTYTLYSTTQISLAPVALAGGGGAGGGAGGDSGASGATGDPGDASGSAPGAPGPSGATGTGESGAPGDPGDATGAPSDTGDPDAPADSTEDSAAPAAPADAPSEDDTTAEEGPPSEAPAAPSAPSTTGCDGCDPDEGISTTAVATPGDFGVFGVVGAPAVGLAQAANQANDAANAAVGAAEAATAAASVATQNRVDALVAVQRAFQKAQKSIAIGLPAVQVGRQLGLELGTIADRAISNLPAPGFAPAPSVGPQASVIFFDIPIPVKLPQTFDSGISFGKKNKINSNYNSLNSADGLFRNHFTFNFSSFSLSAATGDLDAEVSASILGFLKRQLNELQKPFSNDAQRIEFSGNTGNYTLETVTRLVSDSIGVFEEVNTLDPIFLELLEILEMNDAIDSDNANAASIFDAIKNFGKKDESAQDSNQIKEAVAYFLKGKEMFIKTIFETIAAVEKQIANIVARREAAANTVTVVEPEKPKTLIDTIKESFTGKKEEVQVSPSSDSRQTAPVVFREPPPDVEFTVSRGDAKGVAILRWNSGRAQSCTGVNFETGGKTSGEVTVQPSEVTVYTITCLTDNKTIRSVTVVPPSAPAAPLPTITLRATSNFTGKETTLSWESENATVCTGTNFDTAGKTKGSATVTQTKDTEYKVTCAGNGGSEARAVFVKVLPEAAVPKNPTLSLRQKGGETILTWSAPSPACTIRGTDGFEFKTETETGSVNAGPTKQGTTNYTIECEVVR